MTTDSTSDAGRRRGRRLAAVLAWAGLGLAAACGVAALLAGPRNRRAAGMGRRVDGTGPKPGGGRPAALAMVAGGPIAAHP